MPESRVPTAGNARNSEDKRTRFPSLHLWENPWEAGLNIRGLRAKKRSIEGTGELLRESKHAHRAPSVGQPQIEALISSLKLPHGAAGQLAADTSLILGWYRLPEWRGALHLGPQQAINELVAASKGARRLRDALERNAVQIEEVIQSLPGDAAFDTLDLLELSLKLDVLVRAAKIAAPLFGLTGSGRRPDRRRNVAIALATQAAEEATGARVEISRGGDNWRFMNEPGRYVRNVLGLLGFSDERVLVGAFDKLRREPRVKQ